ncbi:nuclear respiratory factor 1 isoform X1 [Lingula anatina]|uniref:Nuclear respiratory factor 1 isoform X1 n=1 Tax=Lingula anatina TaxID=7574 RepID=A0A1S3JWM4_LINAN|nr:nuclear respiratory factor 1 isoform X1 [Lingula anatina]|eukprot:XP_013414773.1 nuclear respiratory factor 1 isoform X1 [Lingula anatina]
MSHHVVTTINTSSINNSGQLHHNMSHHSMISDDMDSEPSSPESSFDHTDLLGSDDVATQLAAAGPIGVAAAAAIATGRKRKRPHSFETNPSIRKRQQTRLLRKLKATIDEFTTRVGQQAVVLCCTPGKPSQSTQSYKVFGSQPLETVVRNSRNTVMQELEQALSQQIPQPSADLVGLHELPPLVIDGIPTPVDKMTQAQLRAFIPEMLKYSTGRGKPNWGKDEFKPLWWPEDVPWANVRSDVRTDEQKKKVSWTHALRTIVKNCYKYHGREDLLPEFTESNDVNNSSVQQHYTQTVMQTINNPDGTLSIIQIDTGSNGPNVVTLPDGTHATVVHAIPHGHEATQAVQTLAEVAANQQGGQQTPVTVEMNSEAATHAVATLAEATLNDGQIILTGEHLGGDGHSMMIPVSMYQTVVSHINQMNQSNQHVHVAMAPSSESQESNSESVPDATHAVEIITVSSADSS